MGKIIVSGPGCSGTTYMVGLLGKLGEETGFDALSVEKGLEWRYHQLHLDAKKKGYHDQSPRVIKYPFHTPNHKTGELHRPIHLFRDADLLNWKIDHVVFMLRSREGMEESRYNRTLSAASNNPNRVVQKKTGLFEYVMEEFYAHLEGVEERQWSYTICWFPRIALDEDYAWDTLNRQLVGSRKPVVASEKAFKKIWSSHSRADRVHGR